MNNNRNRIKSFERGLKVLETICRSLKPLTLTEVSDRMNLTLPATQRFLNSLCATGYASRNKDKCYFPNPKLLSLTTNLVGGSTLARLSGNFLDTLYSELNETINLSILDGSEIVHLDRREGYSVLKYSLGPGSRLPAHCTSTGKLLLSGLLDEDVRARFAEMPLPALTPLTVTSLDDLIRQLEIIRTRGYSLCDRELSMDLFSIAVPLFDENGEMVAGVNATTGFLGIEAKMKKIISKLLWAGAEISKLLGYHGVYPHAEG